MVEGIGTPAPDIMATYDNGGLTKTTLTTDEEGVGTIWWSPADEINVFYGTTSTHYKSNNSEKATTVTFSTTDVIGSTEQAETNIWGLYPYDKSAICDGTSVTTTIPSIQYGAEGTFDEDLFPSIAHSNNTDLKFYNVCGGIRFSVSYNISRITIEGNNGEDIAGKVKITMDENGVPRCAIVKGEKKITVVPKSEQYFKPGNFYYIIMLPTTFEDGFTMSFSNGSPIDYLEKLEYREKLVTIKRSVFSRKEKINTYYTSREISPDRGYVDLGLSTCWLKMNLGATSAEDYGDYFAWGENKIKNSYSWENYKYSKGTQYTLTKYVPQTKASTFGHNGFFDGRNELQSNEDDVAACYNWRIPKTWEWEELINKCTWTRETRNGVKGYKVTSNVPGYTDQSIFLPMAGYRYEDTFFNQTAGTYGDEYFGEYWTSRLYENYPADASCAHITYSTQERLVTSQFRCYGLPIRPVVDMEY